MPKESLSLDTRIIEEITTDQIGGVRFSVHKTIEKGIDEISIAYIYAAVGFQIERIIPIDWWKACPSIRDIIDAAVVAWMLLDREK